MAKPKRPKKKPPRYTMKIVLFALLAGIVSAVPKEWSTPLKEGDHVPNVEFVTRTRIESDSDNPFDWKVRTSDDYFKGKRVVLFALPGAFTPTCSSTHLPGYEALYKEILAEGIDDVYCLCKCFLATKLQDISLTCYILRIFYLETLVAFVMQP